MEDNQELLFKFSMFEQQIQQLQQQQHAIEQGILEMESIYSGIDEISAGKEIMSPLGRGVFAKAKLISDELIVDTGDKNFVKKSAKDTKELIKIQIKKLGEVKTEINKELDKLSDEITSAMQEAQDKEKGHKHSHNCSCGDDCNCEDDCECEDDECKCDDEECKGKKK